MNNNQLSLFEISPNHSEESWKEFLGEILFSNLIDSAGYVNCMRTTLTIYPEKGDILKFMQLQPKDINVVILGQDPYYNGNATGLAFACKNSISPSLMMIADAIYNTYGYTINNDQIGLEHWVKQGILLLNTALTVIENQPGSHTNYWKDIMTDIIEVIGRKEKVIWILLGNYAQNFAYLIKDKSMILKDIHPAALKRNGYKNWNTPIFKNCNELLIKCGKQPIKWF